jgi:fructokinase
LEAHYLGQAVANLVCTLSPQRIVIGGGVAGHTGLFLMIRAEAQRLLNGYVQMPTILERMDEYVVPPGLGGRAGVLGSIVLAEQALGN